MIGVDEAGKGPVIGSMFVAGVRCKEIDFDVYDSKSINSKTREDMYRMILDKCEVVCIEVDSSSIDSSNLNSLTIKSHSNIIDSLFHEGETIICDACLSDTDSYQERIVELGENGYSNLICENEADSNFDIVSAASIVAKEKRESHIESLIDEVGVNFGSGYPSDSRTIDFLEQFYEENGCFPSYVRKSWSTCSDIIESDSQKSLQDY